MQINFSTNHTFIRGRNTTEKELMKAIVLLWQNRKMIFRLLQIAVPFVWFGLIGGISFMETPLKFTAPNITLALGLGIGRVVFHALNLIEIALAALMIISFIAARPKGKFAFYSFTAIAILLLLQTVWLLPALDARATEIINGQNVPDSYLHFVYIAFDAIKFILLFALGTSLTKRNLIKL